MQKLSTAPPREPKKEGREKESPPQAPLKEKGSQKETADIDIRYRRPVSGCLRAEDFFSGEYDPVDIAMTVTGGRRSDRALWRTYLRNGSIEEGEFLQCCFTQWRENMSDGYPNNSAACLTKKIRPFLSGAKGLPSVARGAKGLPSVARGAKGLPSVARGAKGGAA